MADRQFQQRQQAPSDQQEQTVTVDTEAQRRALAEQREKQRREEIVRLVKRSINPIALRTAKTLWSFGPSECNRVKWYYH